MADNVPDELGESSTPARNRQLDGLRAIAVALVLLSHFPSLPVFHGALWGQMGVHAFFVLSGFLITGILLDGRTRVEQTQTRTRDVLKAFYLRRALRIFPLYYLFIIFLYWVNVNGMRDVFLYHLAYISNFGMAIENRDFGHNTHFWSLAVEEQFYLLWPWMVLCLNPRRLPGLILATIGGAILFRLVGLTLHLNNYTLRITTPAVVDSLAIGALLAWMHRHPHRLIKTRRWMVRGGLRVAAPAAFIMSVLHGADALPWFFLIVVYNPMVALATFAVVDRAAAGVPGRVGRFLQSRPMVYWGERSYGIYVIHLCVPYILNAVLLRLGLSEPQGVVLTLFVPVGITLLAAMVSWRVIEKPCNNLKRFFRYAGDAPAPTARPVMPRAATF